MGLLLWNTICDASNRIHHAKNDVLVGAEYRRYGIRVHKPLVRALFKAAHAPQGCR